jgi:hypothetical protein
MYMMPAMTASTPRTTSTAAMARELLKVISSALLSGIQMRGATVIETG